MYILNTKRHNIRPSLMSSKCWQLKKTCFFSNDRGGGGGKSSLKGYYTLQDFLNVKLAVFLDLVLKELFQILTMDVGGRHIS